ncbi:MAG: radical SAM protein [Thermodesulfobacteriota bacterium]|nr:radical SAM protein [Thermodesulfobacteriota bacterium]
MNDLYPLPGEVCRYAKYEHFLNHRYQTGQWVFWEDQLTNILRGEYNNVFPLHVEYTITYQCNFNCPWCSCRAARRNFARKKHPHSELDNIANPYIGWNGISKILHHLAEKNVGIQWTGGEPLIHPNFINAVKKANALGIKQCIFSNGSLLNNSTIHSLLESAPEFIRISLNAIAPETHAKFHGLPSLKYSKKVLENIESLVAIKLANNSKTLIGLSFVIDYDNLNETDNIVNYLKYLCNKYGPKPIDYCILRPAYAFNSSIVHLSNADKKALNKILSPSSLNKKVGERSEIDFIVPDFSFQTQMDHFATMKNLECISYGLFGEITPIGEMIICSDKYGDNEFSIGNISKDALSTIWKSDIRSSIINKVNSTHCLQKQCPRNGRGFLFNQIFHDIEYHRGIGQINLVSKWIDDLRNTIPIPTHSFYL